MLTEGRDEKEERNETERSWMALVRMRNSAAHRWVTGP